jgi:hypothetical protein
MNTEGLHMQNQNFEFPQFVFLKNKQIRVPSGNTAFPSMNVQKPRGTSSRGNFSKPFYSQQISQPSQGRSVFQAQGNRFNGNKLTKGPNFGQNIGKFENQYGMNKYVQGSGSKSSPEKATKSCYGSTASESDGSHASSELSGFKIVHRGKIVHDETEEDFDSPTDLRMSCRFEEGNGKFAASGLVIGPSAKDISLPTFC